MALANTIRAHVMLEAAYITANNYALERNDIDLQRTLGTLIRVLDVLIESLREDEEAQAGPAPARGPV